MAELEKSSALNRAYSTALDWLFPAQCAGCKTIGEVWCASCDSAVARIEEPYCLICGFPLNASFEDCPTCSHSGFIFDRARSWGLYERELRAAILGLKHRKNKRLAEALAQGLLEIYKREKWSVDMVVPVPLGPKRLSARGFNQADLLAQSFSHLSGLPVSGKALLRVRETGSQVGLDPSERRENLRDAFIAKPDLLKDTTVLIIDDVMTTGATLDSAAAALKLAGAKTVFALTIARAIWERIRIW